MKLKRTLQALALSAIIGAPTIVLASGCGTKAQFRKPPVFDGTSPSGATDQSVGRPLQRGALSQNIVVQNTKEWNDYRTKLQEARDLGVALPAAILDEASRLSISSSVGELSRSIHTLQTWINQVRAQAGAGNPITQNPPASSQSHDPVVINLTEIRKLIHISGNNGFGSLDDIAAPCGVTIDNEDEARQGTLLNGDVITLKITSESGEMTLKYTVANLPTAPATQSPVYTPSQYMASGSKVSYTLTVENVNGVNRDSIVGDEHRVGDIYPSMWQYDIWPYTLENAKPIPYEEYWKSYVGRKYTVTGIGDAKFSIWFDSRSHTDETIEKRMIDKFINETNWGVGLLSLRNIFFVSGDIGRQGTDGKASNFQDIVIALNDIVAKGAWDVNDNSRAQWKFIQLQRAMATMQHEYGHHETLNMYMDVNNVTKSVSTMRQALIKYHALAADVAAAVVQAEGGNKQPVDDLISAYVAKMKTLPSFSQIIGNAFGDGAPFGLTKLSDNEIMTNHFDLTYQFGPAEYLNRFINTFELTNLFDDIPELADPENIMNMLYQTSPLMSVMIPYAFANQPIIDANRVYTQKALDTYDLYTKYVYGFNNPNPRKRLLIDNYALRGYSPTEFDFLRLEADEHGGVVGRMFGNLAGASDREDVVKIRKVPTHFFTRKSVFGPKQFVDTKGYAYFAATEDVLWTTLRSYLFDINGGMLNANIIHAYRDSNHNGVLDQNDADVTDELKQVSNWSVNNNNHFNSNVEAE